MGTTGSLIYLPTASIALTEARRPCITVAVTKLSILLSLTAINKQFCFAVTLDAVQDGARHGGFGPKQRFRSLGNVDPQQSTGSVFCASSYPSLTITY
jgi:hypothetical protein